MKTFSIGALIAAAAALGLSILCTFRQCAFLD